MATVDERAVGLRRAFRLEVLTATWMVVEAVVSVEAGVYAGSVLLIAFGADSLIELISALVLLWRLRRESRALHGDEARVIRIERKAASIAGVLLYLLALFVTIEAVVSLFHRHAAQSSGAGLVVAMLAAVGMPLLANAKLRVADQIGSRALRADAAESITCGYLAWVLLAGLVANRALHLWWLDSVAALILVPFLLREGREAIQGKSCGACRTQPADEDPPRDHKPDAPAREV